MSNNQDLTMPEEMPRDSYSLIQSLNKAYPHRCIRKGETLESAQRYAGMRELVDSLVRWMEDEIETDKVLQSSAYRDQFYES